MISTRLFVVASMAIVPVGLVAAADRVSEGQHGPAAAEPGFIVGADISRAQQQEDEGIRRKGNTKPEIDSYETTTKDYGL